MLNEEAQSKRAFEQWENLGMPDTENVKQACDCESIRLYVYGVLARLSLLAAAIELENMPD